jgi:hypothetical protein
MDEQLSIPSRRVSRAELYALVWQTPMSRLAVEFGITGNGLAKICDRLAVPYPPRGYWAKKEAGKPVIALQLPARMHGIPESADIYPTPTKPAPSPDVRARVAAATATVAEIVVPETLEGLHPKVNGWFAEHRREQKEREQENRRHKNDPWAWISPLEELTHRDLYRFRVSSAIFKAVEKAGGKVENAPITGKVSFLVSGQRIECSIVEKMLKPIGRRSGDTATWTAYPEHHQAGLQSSGFLRVSITTYLPGKQPQWIEAPDKKMADMLPEIVGAIVGAGSRLIELQREREEDARRHREEQARRLEQQRLKEIDDRSWAKFREQAADWEERGRLLAFVAELQRRLETEGDLQIGDRSLREWIAWAYAKIAELDPLRDGLRRLLK